MIFRCLICSHASGTFVLRKGGLVLARCNRCRFVQQDPLPEAQEYDSRYEDAGGYSDELLRDKHLFQQRDERVVHALSLLGAQGPLLDVGAGAGILMEAARKLGWEAIGLELAKPSLDRIRMVLRMEAHACAIEHAPFAPGTFGAITFSHSLEHLLDPLLALRSAAGLLRPGGLVHIAVPHWRCVKRLVAGKEIPWIFGEHISYFTRRSLADALDRAGFELLEGRTLPMVCDVDYRFAIIVFERFGLGRLARRFLRLGNRRLDSLLTDNVQVDCSPWRLRLVIRTARAFLKAWPEWLFSKVIRIAEIHYL